MQDTYRTTTLAVAAFLIAGRHLLLDHIEIDESGRGVFVFHDPNGNGTKLQNRFLTADAEVPGLKFHTQIRTLRRLLDEAQRNNHGQRNHHTERENAHHAGQHATH